MNAQNPAPYSGRAYNAHYIAPAYPMLLAGGSVIGEG